MSHCLTYAVSVAEFHDFHVVMALFVKFVAEKVISPVIVRAGLMSHENILALRVGLDDVYHDVSNFIARLGAVHYRVSHANVYRLAVKVESAPQAAVQFTLSEEHRDCYSLAVLVHDSFLYRHLNGVYLLAVDAVYCFCGRVVGVNLEDTKPGLTL